MSIFSKVKSLPHHLPHGTAPGSGVMPFLWDKGERSAASWGWGALKGYYRERATVKIGPVTLGYDLLGGALLLLGSSIMQMWSYGGSHAAKHLERIGDAGLQSYFNSLGTSWGARKSGRTVYVLDAGAKKPGSLPAGLSEVLGMIPQAGDGDVLDEDEIASWSSK